MWKLDDNKSIKNIVLSIGLCISLQVQSQEKHTAHSNRPNVILLMADDLDWGDTGFNGNPVIKTPNLDKMAKDGVKFNRFYSTAPVCSTTLASCLNGCHPYRTGVFFAITGILRPEELTLAEVLKNEGYSTGHFGKWHVGAMARKFLM